VGRRRKERDGRYIGKESWRETQSKRGWREERREKRGIVKV
jgi:hypothetical protein